MPGNVLHVMRWNRPSQPCYSVKTNGQMTDMESWRKSKPESCHPFTSNAFDRALEAKYVIGVAVARWWVAGKAMESAVETMRFGKKTTRGRQMTENKLCRKIVRHSPTSWPSIHWPFHFAQPFISHDGKMPLIKKRPDTIFRVPNGNRVTCSSAGFVSVPLYCSTWH
jgi:hypothetical protein